MEEKNFQYVGNVRLLDMEKPKILSKIHNNLANGVKTRVFFVNAHCYNIAQKNSEYRKHLAHAEMVLNDGLGIEIAAKLFNFEVKENLNGTDFTPEVLGIIDELKMKLYLLGGKPGIAYKAGEAIKAQYPGIQVAGMSDGFFEDAEILIEEINRLKPDLLLVGMGVPLQENWISTHFDRLNVSIVMAVGAFLDFTSGAVMRAPVIVRKMRAEWTFRLLMEPGRMWRRYLVGNVVFFRHIYWQSRSKKVGTDTKTLETDEC